MIIIVNRDLKMGAGKTAGQCCHGVSDVVERLLSTNRATHKKWKKSGQEKIVKKANQRTIEHLLDLYGKSKTFWCIPTYDQGKTEVEHGSFTVLTFCPIAHMDIPDDIHELSLL